MKPAIRVNKLNAAQAAAFVRELALLSKDLAGFVNEYCTYVELLQKYEISEKTARKLIHGYHVFVIKDKDVKKRYQMELIRFY